MDGELLHVHRHLARGERRHDLLEPEPSRIVTSVVGPNSWPWSAATISDGRSVGDRSNVPAAIVPSRPAVMIAYWKAMLAA